MSEVRTRFAPSPTGYMHIGGMRTALFNWLWARHNGGKFILRIDDTDQQRNMDEALGPILRAFRWLGLDWDEGVEVGGPHGPYFQSQRGDLYRAAVDKLLDDDKAYRCYAVPEEIAAKRTEAEKAGRQYVHRESQLTGDQRAQYESEDRPAVVRFRVPAGHKIVINDLIRGRVEFDGDLISDPVIQRANGSALYNLATVVDDAGCEITHVIRAEEHLSNTPIQVMLHEALGNTLPTFAHVPYVAAPGTKQKLSKRKLDKYRKSPAFKPMFDAADAVFPRIGLETGEGLDPVMVEYYERIGYLPAAIINSLSRLGWSLDDKTEILSRETLIEEFTLDRVIKAPAGFDPDKLLACQAHWMGELSLEEKIAGCLPFLIGAGLLQEETVDRDYLGRVITAIGERLKLFSDVLAYDEFFVNNDALAYDEKGFQKRLVNPPEAAELLAKFRDRLATADDFEPDALETTMKSFADEQEIKLGQIIHAVRVAVTGKPQGPGMFDCLAVLGRERCLARIDRALSRL